MLTSTHRAAGALAMVISALAALPSVAGATPAHRGKHHHKAPKPKAVPCGKRKAVQRSGRTVIYKLPARFSEAFGDPVADYEACLAPKGKPMVLAINDLGNLQYGSDSALRGLAIGGTYAGSVTEIGFSDYAQCTKYTPGPYTCLNDLPTDQIAVVDLTHRAAGAVTAPTGSTGLTLSSMGAAAWLSPAGTGTVTLNVATFSRSGRKLTLTTRPADTGSIPATSLAWNGLTLSWSDGGTAKTLTVS